MQELIRKYADVADLSLSEHHGLIILSRIVVTNKNQGIGTRIMNDLTSYADAHGLTIALTPDSVYGGSVSRLRKFYKRFGFVENKGKNADYEISQLYYRLPS